MENTNDKSLKRLQEKLKSVLEEICDNSHTSFTKLFSNKDEDYILSHREKVTKRWFKDVNPERTLRDNFEYYPFSALQLGGEPLFTKESFFALSLVAFNGRIKKFLMPDEGRRVKIDTDYRFLYYFDKHQQRILSYQLTFEKKFDEYFKACITNRDTQEKMYKRVYRVKENLIIENLNDKDAIYYMVFSCIKLDNNPEHIYGIFTSTTKKLLPIARKVILSKKVFDAEAIERLNFILNSVHHIIADDHILDYQTGDLFRLRNTKVKDIKELFKTLKVLPSIDTNFYTSMFFQEFFAISKIFEKVLAKSSYFVESSERVLSTFITSMFYDDAKDIYIALPIYSREENPLLNNPELIVHLDKLSKTKNIHIRFSIQRTNIFSPEFIRTLQELNEQTSIDIRFSLIGTVEHCTDSLEILYTNKQNFLAIKYNNQDRSRYSINSEKSAIQRLTKFYNSIDKFSFSLEDTLSGKIYNDSTFDSLVGTWHYYSYGSFDTKEGVRKVWSGEILITPDKIAEVKQENYIYRGELHYNAKDTLIFGYDDVKLKSYIINFDNKDIDHIFKINVITKVIKKDTSMFSAGVMSKEPLEMPTIRHILGEVDNVQFMPAQEIKDRIFDTIIKKS